MERRGELRHPVRRFNHFRHGSNFGKDEELGGSAVVYKFVVTNSINCVLKYSTQTSVLRLNFTSLCLVA